MPKGKRVQLSNGRRLVDDVIRMARKQPMAAFSRDLDVSELAELRRQIKPRLSWNAIMMKAYAMVGQDVPELRQTYVALPWPHLFQSEQNVAMITLARKVDGETRLMFGRFHRPESYPLVELQAQLDYYQEEPIDRVKQFRHQQRFAALPSMLRRLLWWLMTDLWPSKRAAHVGTFGMSISGFQGTYANSAHLGPNATILGVDPAPRNGIARTVITFDHRILDGKPTIDIMNQLYRKLKGPILQEMTQLAARSEADAQWDQRAA